MNENKYLKRFLNPASIVAIMWTLVQIWVIIRGQYPALIFRSLHVGFAIGLAFLSLPMFEKYKVKKGQQYIPKWYEYIFFSLSVFCVVYILHNSPRLMTHMAMIDRLATMDYVVGCLFIILLLESSRRAAGIALTGIVILFLAYAFFGAGLPGLLGHSGQTLTRVMESQMFSTSGIFSSPTHVSANTVFYFLLFGAFLTATPSSTMFINISSLLTRNSVGGAGKATIVAAGFFGMISGSASANTTSIGSIMYPALKKEKFSPVFSGSILALGGTSGQMVPPVMGAAAFIMVDIIGTSYAEVMTRAIIPSILYLAALFFLVHFYSLKNKLTQEPLDTEQYKQLKKDIVKHLHLLLPVVLLVVMIIQGFTMMRSTTFASFFLFIICLFRKDTRIGLFRVLEIFETTAKQSIVIALPSAMAGIIIGVIVTTGLGLRFSSMLNAIAQNSLLIALIVAMLMAIILGMGAPTSAAYIMCAVLLAPTIVNLGVPVIVAHFFILYFANLSMITPPVALASYAAAGIVEEDLFTVGIEAFKYSLIIFMIPFTFVYRPAALGIGSIPQIIHVLFTSLLGVYAVAMGFIGYGLMPINMVERILLIVAAVLLIFPQTVADLIGLIIFVLCIAYQFSHKKKLNM